MLNRWSYSRWRHQMETFSGYWPFVRGIHRSLVTFPHKDQWREALVFSLTCSWIIGWVNSREAGDLRHHRAHCDVIVISKQCEILTRLRHIAAKLRCKPRTNYCWFNIKQLMFSTPCWFKTVISVFHLITTARRDESHLVWNSVPLILEVLL